MNENHLQDFFVRVKIGYKRRQVIYSSVIIWALAYAFMPPSLEKLTVFLIGGVTAQVMVGLVVQKLSPVLELMFSRAKKEPLDIPEMIQLAEKIGIKLPKNPFWITDKNVTANTNTVTGTVTIGKKFYDKLTKNELIFVFAHEFTHLKRKQLLYPYLTVFPATFIAFFGFSYLQIPQIVSILAVFATMLVIHNFVSRRLEFLADIGGATYVDNETAVNTIKKVYSEMGLTHSTETHPSGDSRIKNLNNFYRLRKN